jgi:hypothetical protein
MDRWIRVVAVPVATGGLVSAAAQAVSASAAAPSWSAATQMTKRPVPATASADLATSITTVSASRADLRRLTAPRVVGPRATASPAPSYRFSAREEGTPARQLRFRCAFDSLRLRACPRLYRAALGVGQHVLRVQAFDRAGHRSRTTVVYVLVEPAVSPAHVLASVAVTDAGAVTFASDGSVWVNRAPGSETGQVSRINPATDHVIATVQASPAGLGIGGGTDIGFGFGSVWVVNYDASTITRIDPATNTVLATISTETGTNSAPVGVAFTAQAVWVAKHEPVGTIVKVDPSTNSIVDEIQVGESVPAGGPPFIVAAAGGIWGNGPGSVVRVDPGTDRVLARVTPCLGNGGSKMATDGVALWAANCDTIGGISRVEPATNTIRTVLPASELAAYITSSPPIVSLTFGGGTLWAAGQCGRSACVLGIDPVTNTIVKAWTVPVAGANLGLGYGIGYGSGSLWLTGGNSVMRLDPGS